MQGETQAWEHLACWGMNVDAFVRLQCVAMKRRMRERELKRRAELADVFGMKS